MDKPTPRIAVTTLDEIPFPQGKDTSLSSLRWQRIDTRLSHIEQTLLALLTALHRLEARDVYHPIPPWK